MKVRKNKKLQVALRCVATDGDVCKIIRHFNKSYYEAGQYLQSLIEKDLIKWDNEIVSLTEVGRKIYEKIK